MLPRLLRWLAAPVLALSLALPFALAQSDSLPSIDRGVRSDPSAPEEPKSGGSSASALPHFIMVLYAMLVLTIVCMPSRRA